MKNIQVSCLQEEIIQRTEQHVRKMLQGENTGHDWWHTKRVFNTARCIAHEEIVKGEKIDHFVVQLAALLHDIADWKFHNGDDSVGPQKARQWLKSAGVDEKTSSHVCKIIKDLSFKGAGVNDAMSTIEGAIVQDADRLDALGAIGIARCFATGVKVGNTLHEPEILPVMHKTADEYKKLRSSSINCEISVIEPG